MTEYTTATNNITASSLAAGSAASPTAATGNRGLFVFGIPKDLPKCEETLTEFFRKAGSPVVKVCRDFFNGTILGYGYVNFETPAEAENALTMLNYGEVTPNNEIQLMHINRDPKSRYAGGCNVFLKNLPPSLTNRKLDELGREYGKIICVKHAKDIKGNFLKYGFIAYETSDEALKAIEALDKKEIDESTLRAQKYVSFHERVEAAEKTFTRVFIKNLKPNITEEELIDIIKPFGDVESVYIGAPPAFETKFALVAMSTHEQAVVVIDNLHNATIDVAAKGNTLFVARLRNKTVSKSGNTIDDGHSIYVKYLPLESSEAFIRSIFNRFGEVDIVCMHRVEGRKFVGSAILHFVNKESVGAAVEALHRKECEFENRGRYLYVQPAEKKDVRHKRIEREVLKAQQVAMYPQQTTVYPQQTTVYPQQPQPHLQPQPQQSHHQQYVQQLHTPYQNYPMINGMQNRQSRPYYIQPYNYTYMQGIPQQQRMYNNNNNMVNMNNMRLPRQQQIISQQQHVQPTHAANEFRERVLLMSESDRKQTLGQRLYPLIMKFNPDSAAKITGMLLEMSVDEVLTTIENTDELAAKVQEAVSVLEVHDSAVN